MVLSLGGYTVCTVPVSTLAGTITVVIIITFWAAVVAYTIINNNNMSLSSAQLKLKTVIIKERKISEGGY
jgi:hypothetical protein